MAITLCQECGGKVSTRAAACPHCGCPVEPQISEMTCSDCGEDFAASLKACPLCGGPVEAPEDPHELAEPTTLAASPKAVRVDEHAANARKDGKKHGLWETHYWNGQLEHKRTYKDGVLHGPNESYSKDGRLERKGTMCMGFPCGEWFDEGETKSYPPCPPDLDGVTVAKAPSQTVQGTRSLMDFETDAGRKIADPSASQIAAELASLPDGGSFAILSLSRDNLTYVQALGNRTEGFILEYQSGSLDQHYRSTEDNLNLSTVTDVFQLYAAEDSSWQSRTKWQREDLG